MQTLTQPELLLKPFAENGDKNDIPLNNETIAQPQLADLTVGFPPITSKDPSDGGLPPERKDFNALGYLTTSYDYFYQAGGTFTFSSTISSAIGGYPIGARLWYTDANGVSCILRSTIENNTNDFTQDDSVIGETGSGKPWEIENFRGISNKGTLFDCKWTDHVLNDISWLRADTFSWQSGAVYVAAYNHLVSDIDGKTAISETVGSYTISYYLADDGHKITTDEQTVTDIYNESGVAWYYILDTTNQRFKLPRTKFGFTGLRDSVGKYVEAGLPQHTHQYIDYYATGGQGHGGEYPLVTDGNTYTTRTTEGASNSIYGNSTTVQPPATQMYLYFYIGNYNQSAIEQTAGLNAELFNGKVDLNAGNVSQTGKERIVGWVMPDYTAGISLTLSTTNNTISSKGYIYCGNIPNGISNTTRSIYINDIRFSIVGSGSGNNYGSVFLPVDVGDTYKVDLTSGIEAMFFPCKGA